MKTGVAHSVRRFTLEAEAILGAKVESLAVMADRGSIKVKPGNVIDEEKSSKMSNSQGSIHQYRDDVVTEEEKKDDQSSFIMVPNVDLKKRATVIMREILEETTPSRSPYAKPIQKMRTRKSKEKLTIPIVENMDSDNQSSGHSYNSSRKKKKKKAVIKLQQSDQKAHDYFDAKVKPYKPDPQP